MALAPSGLASSFLRFLAVMGLSLWERDSDEYSYDTEHTLRQAKNRGDHQPCLPASIVGRPRKRKLSLGILDDARGCCSWRSISHRRVRRCRWRECRLHSSLHSYMSC